MDYAFHPLKVQSHHPIFRPLRQAGILIESLFVLLTIVSVLAGSMAIAAALLNDSTAKREAEAVNELADNIRRIKKFDGYAPSADMTHELMELQLVPYSISMNTNTIQLTNQWSGSVRVRPQDAGGNFAITYENIPENICKSMMLNIPAGTLQTVGPGTAGSSGGASSDLLIAELTTRDISRICGNSAVHWSSGVW